MKRNGLTGAEMKPKRRDVALLKEIEKVDHVEIMEHNNKPRHTRIADLAQSVVQA